ncbi:MAG: hypothetical protein U5L01_08410 [Rheinheimera sp.]|nr:hypothetical protein [Rheinheimera sp.]
MDAKALKLGMLCHSEQGVGVVRWIDGQDRAVYLSNPERSSKKLCGKF